MEIKNSNINENENFIVESEVKIYKNLLKDISTCKETQNKWMLIMKDRGKMREFKMLLIIIKQDFKEELHEKGTAYYLVGIFMHCLNHFEFWQKLALIIGSEKFKSIREALKNVIGIKCIYKKIMETIELYFNSLQSVDNEYFICEEKLPENNEKSELLKILPFNHVAIIVYFLLHHPKVGTKTANDIYVYSSYDEEFIKYLKEFIRNFSLM